MGERVNVGVRSEQPKPVEPLNYAKPSTSSVRMEKVMGIIRLAGGVRQILFAVGVACVGAGIGEWNWYERSGNAAVWLFFGGILLGFAVPAPRWRS